MIYMRNITITTAKSATYLENVGLKATTKLHALWMTRNDALIEAGVMPGTTSQLNDLGRHLPHVSEAGEGLLLSIFTVYQAYFHRMHSRVKRIGSALKNDVN